MNGFSLIAEIGGSMSLFIGVNFLSFLELLEVVCETVSALIQPSATVRSSS
jgi:hypothetical protein